jgi:hypothetical protein
MRSSCYSQIADHWHRPRRIRAGASGCDVDQPSWPGTVKLGCWYHAGLFADQRFAVNGLSQADPNASAMPAQLRSDFGIYGVFEQQVWKIP